MHDKNLSNEECDENIIAYKTKTSEIQRENENKEREHWSGRI